MIVGPADDGDVPAVDERKLDTRYSRRYRGTNDTRRVENTVRISTLTKQQSEGNRAVSQHGVRLLSIDDDEE